MQLSSKNRTTFLTFGLCLLIALIKPTFGESLDLNSEKLTITEQLNFALQNKNVDYLYGVEERIYAIWRGEKSTGIKWKKLRDEQFISILKTLEILEAKIDWEFNSLIPIEKTMSPPLDHTIMRYSTGLGVSQIKDPIKRTEIQQKLKVELTRLENAQVEHEFQVQINQRYDSLLRAFISLFSTYKLSTAEVYLNNLIIKNIKDERVRLCLQRFAESFYKVNITETDRLLEVTKGNCRLVLAVNLAKANG